MRDEEWNQKGMGVHIRIQPMQGETDEWLGEDLVLQPVVYNRVQYLKELLQKQHPTLQGLKPSQLDLVYDGVVLSDAKMLLEYGLAGSAEEPCTVKFAVQNPGSVGVGLSSDPLIDAHCPGMKAVVEAAVQGMLKGYAPRLEDGSTGGTYRVFGPDMQPVGVLKPCDEEAFAPLNPHTYVGPCGSPGFVNGVYSGTGASREVAAYVMDHEHFAQVPKTTSVQARNPSLNNGEEAQWKNASLQEFVRASGHAGDYNPRFFSVSAVQRIAILDMRIVNLDRNEGNLLVQTQPGTTSPSSSMPCTLIPIDHGACLPDAIGATTDSIVWMSWPQVREPFGPEELAYIRNLDVNKDLNFLSEVLKIDEPCLRLARATTRLLQIGAEAGLTAYDIGKMIYRADFDTPSLLESVVEQCATASSAQSSPDLDALCLEPARMPPSPTRNEGAAITMRVEFKSPDTSPVLSPALFSSPFPSLSLNVDADPKLKFSSSTPSTRASSPMTGLPPALELPRLNDFEQQPFLFLDHAEEPTHPLPAALFLRTTASRYEPNSWTADRTKLFRQKMEGMILNICSTRLH
jgi:hypothetical protein